MREIYDLRADLRIRLATFRKSVLQTCVDLRRLASPFGQSFTIFLGDRNSLSIGSGYLKI